MRREPAHPMLIKDLLSASIDEVEVEGGTRRSYFITPTGARVYRVVVTGVLMECENIGSEDSPLLKVRMADSTSGLSFTVGRYHPNLLKKLTKMTFPSFVSVIGKVKNFRSKKGDEILSINPETISICTREERDLWVLMASRDALLRRWKLEGGQPIPLEGMGDIKVEEPRGGEELDPLSSTLIKKALLSVDPTFFMKAMENRPVQPDDEENPEDQHEEYEERVLSMIGELDGGQGARWDDVIKYVEKKRLSRDIIEEVVSNLLDKGMIYEPVLGYLKAI